MTLPHSPLQTAFGYDGPQIPQPQSQSHPSSYHQLSDLRTGSKRKRESITITTTSSSSNSSALSTPPTAQSDNELGVQVAPSERCLFDSVIATPHDTCADCVVDCDGTDCQASASGHCTDQCILVPCSGNDLSTCSSACTEEPCQFENCDGGNPCFATLDESLQLLCCTTYHDCDAASSQINWPCSLDELLGMNGPNYGFPACSHLPVSNNQLTNSFATNSAPELPPLIQTGSSTLSSAFQEKTVAGNALPTPSPTGTSRSLTQSTTTTDFICRWLGCNLSFGSLNELVGHVNLTHLRPSSTASPRPSKKPRLSNTAQDSGLALSCRWDDCHLYPDASTLPGPSTGLQPEMAFDLLSSHFFHDHLGLAVPPSQVLPGFQTPGQPSLEAQRNDTGSIVGSSVETKPTEADINTHSTVALNGNTPALHSAEPTYATPEPSPPTSPSNINPSATSGPPHDCSTSTHTCHWHSCGLSFTTCAALTEHLTLAHVGSGKGHYDCHWGECTRSGKQGFSSKQKIMRHLQAHTGYRPFPCKECGQFFSEAATLAQHMRRHTQEKPFVCDFPGCGKAFAITGALTIHKRTHNGERPFHCPHCERGFAESSNLSKHLRTHTGDRPYRCAEPGCGKAFARPDQLQRHGNVHKKKAVGAVAPVGGAGSASGEAIVVK